MTLSAILPVLHRVEVEYTTSYVWDDDDRLEQIIMPRSRAATYSRGSVRHIAGIGTTVNGVSQDIVSDIRYRAGNQVAGCTYGDDPMDARSYCKIISVFLFALLFLKAELVLAEIDMIEAIKIAETALAREKPGYDDMAIRHVHKHTTPDNFLADPCKGEVVTGRDALFDYEVINPELCTKLKGKTYWRVYFIPMPYGFVLDGSIAFFIDAETSEIMHVYRAG